MRGGAVWQLVGLITRRSQVQILPPLPDWAGRMDPSGVVVTDDPRKWHSARMRDAGFRIKNRRRKEWALCPFFVSAIRGPLWRPKQSWHAWRRPLPNWRSEE